MFELGERELNLGDIGLGGMFAEIVFDGLNDLAAPPLNGRAQRTQLLDARLRAGIRIPPPRVVLKREESFRLGDDVIAVMRAAGRRCRGGWMSECRLRESSLREGV
jgi:hypothetical protein